jgi:hypothetical protein
MLIRRLPVTETYLLRACSRFLHEEKLLPGVAAGVLPGLSFSGYDEQQVLARVRDFALGFFREMAAKAGKRRWAEKTAFDTFHVDNIERLFAGHCYFVCVVRHGLDTVCSMKELCDKTDRYAAELHPYIQRYPRPLEALAHAWADLNERLLKLMADHPARCVMLRYEDLVASPEAEMKRLFDFLGEGVDDVSQTLAAALQRPSDIGLGDWKIHEKKSVEASSVGRWRALPTDTAARLYEILGPTMTALGYEPVTVQSETDEAARRRFEHAYELARAVAALQGPRGPGDA